MVREINVLALIKSDSRFIFAYDDESVDALIDHIRDLAVDPAVALNWFDAAELTRRARGQVEPEDAEDLHD